MDIPVTVQSVPSGHVPSTVHPWSSSAAAPAAPAVPGAGVVVTPEQAGGSSHAGAGAPFRLNAAVGLKPGVYLGRSQVSERLIIRKEGGQTFQKIPSRKIHWIFLSVYNISTV